jgi:hypothetical protein
MNRLFRRNWALVAVAVIATPCLFGSSCSGPIIPFTGPVTAAAKALDGTYRIAATGAGDASGLPADPTLVISGGLFTKLGTTALTPTDFQNPSTNNFIWTSAATLTRNGTSATSTATMNVNLQNDGTLTGTMVFGSGGRTSNPLTITLTKE